jgi:hypothetical protein
MRNYHIEVHSRDRQIEHYIVPMCDDRDEAIQRIKTHYKVRGQKVGMWEQEEDRLNLEYSYLIFRIVELDDEPVIYISGEYRSQFPI